MFWEFEETRVLRQVATICIVLLAWSMNECDALRGFWYLSYTDMLTIITLSERCLTRLIVDWHDLLVTLCILRWFWDIIFCSRVFSEVLLPEAAAFLILQKINDLIELLLLTHFIYMPMDWNSLLFKGLSLFWLLNRTGKLTFAIFLMALPLASVRVVELDISGFSLILHLRHH